MAKISVADLLCFGLQFSLAAGNDTTTTRMAASSGHNVPEEHEINERLESMQQALSNLERVTEKRVLALETKLEATEAKLEARDTALPLKRAQSKSNRKASTFVRWGRKTCESSAELVYSGVVGGSNFNESGGAANPLCLTMDPKTDPTAKHTHYNKLYGAEYEQFGNHHDHDVPCCVCRASQSTTIMLPGTQICPTGWTTQYTGYLSAGYGGFAAASQYVCLDKDMEDDESGVKNQNGYLFYYTHAVCGSLPCPPYENNQVVLCAVCSQ